MTCPRCEAHAERQAGQLAPRNLTKGVAIVAREAAFVWRSEQPDIRLGDVVAVELIAAAVEDAPWCEECEEA